jgi:hypothetical protein
MSTLHWHESKNIKMKARKVTGLKSYNVIAILTLLHEIKILLKNNTDVSKNQAAETKFLIRVNDCIRLVNI